MRISGIVFLALLAVPAATAAGPWLGTASNGLGSYTATVRGNTTTVGDGSNSISVAGKWGIPIVTLNEGVGGLSTDRRVLVLAQAGVIRPNGALARTSSFLVLHPKPLRTVRTLTIRGDFGFDTLSPNGRWLYLIQHVSQNQVFRYRVRAYDLRTGRLLARVIADKRQRGWLMTGSPVARTATADGRWVYTLYSSGNNYPFVHALDTTARTAICVGLPWAWTAPADQEAMNADLQVEAGKLVVAGNHGAGTTFAVDTRTFEVTKT